MVLFRVMTFFYPLKIRSLAISSEVYVCVSIHINLVPVFGICHEETYKYILERRKEIETVSERLIRRLIRENMNYGVLPVVFSPFFYCSISLYSFTDNNYKIKIMVF